MIFGNPGIYDKDGNFSNFAILVDRICNSNFFSVNLCIDMNIYPNYLAYNSGENISIELNNKELLINEDESLFHLKDDDLLVELVRMKFNDLYQIECLIRSKKIERSSLLSSDHIYDLIDYNYETDNRFYWDIDNLEYRNIFPFVINFSGFSRIAIVSINEPNSIEMDNIFFDKRFWNICTTVIRTDELDTIMRSAYNYILNSN